MTRINTNLPSLLGALYMNRNMEVLNVALERMATGVRINSAKDDPQGVISSDVLRGELTGIRSAITNAERANNLLATAEGSMASISDMLLEIESVIHQVANSGTLTGNQIEAFQLQIDNLIQAIDQVADSASFAGQRLLDGSLGYVTQGVDAAAIDDLTIYKAPIGSTGSEIPISIDLLTSAEQGSLIFPNATVAGPVTVRLTGPEGSTVLEFPAGATSSGIVAAVCDTTGKTGLTAELVNGDPLQGARIKTVDYGSSARVSIEVLAGDPADFALEDEGGLAATADAGVDIELSVNGSHVFGQGLRAHYANASTDMELILDEAWNAAGPPATTDFEITSGGALFQLGPQISASQQDSIGIKAVDSTNLGVSALGYLKDLASGGALSLRMGRITDMKRVVTEASRQLASTRARVGSFQNNTLAMAINSLKQAQENVSAARSVIVDTDYAEETAVVTRQQILINATQSAMAMAYSVPEAVLSLLRD